MIITAVAMLNKNQSPTRQEIIAGLEDNLCRCGAHTRIIDAVEDASKSNERREVAMKKHRKQQVCIPRKVIGNEKKKLLQDSRRRDIYFLSAMECT